MRSRYCANHVIHDGILFEESDPARLDQAKQIMLQAGRDTCGGLEIGVDEDQRLIAGQRYADKRPMAKRMWKTIMDALDKIGARRRGSMTSAINFEKFRTKPRPEKLNARLSRPKKRMSNWT